MTWILTEYQDSLLDRGRFVECSSWDQICSCVNRCWVFLFQVIFFQSLHLLCDVWCVLQLSGILDNVIVVPKVVIHIPQLVWSIYASCVMTFCWDQDHHLQHCCCHLDLMLVVFWICWVGNWQARHRQETSFIIVNSYCSILLTNDMNATLTTSPP